MTTSLLNLIIWIYVESITNTTATWNIASERFSREHTQMSVGAYGGTIFLIGSWAYPHQVSKYEIATNTLTTSLNVLATEFAGGDGQHWTQQGSILYIIPQSFFDEPPSNSPLSIYNMETEELTSNWRGITTPEFIGLTACLSSTPQNLYVIGGGDELMPSKWSSSLQILSLSTYQWQTIPPPPSMNEQRGGLSCIISSEYLWVFGGYANSMVYDSNERIHIVNIAQNAWEYVDSLTLPLRDTRAVSWGDAIYIIGGVQSIDGLSGEVAMVHIMDTKSATVSVSPDTMPFFSAGSAPIVVDNILYAFGGMHGSDGYLTTEWVHYTLQSITTSSDPTTSPSNIPTQLPSDLPTRLPSNIPTDYPSTDPTHLPSNDPTRLPSHIPTHVPSIKPSSDATRVPSANPSSVPTPSETINPSASVVVSSTSMHPPGSPSDAPSLHPSKRPRLWANVTTHSTGFVYNVHNIYTTFSATAATISAMDKNDNDNTNGDMWRIMAWVGMCLLLSAAAACFLRMLFKKWKSKTLVEIEKEVMHFEEEKEKDMNVNNNNSVNENIAEDVEGDMRVTVEGEKDDSDHRNDDLLNDAAIGTIEGDDDGDDLWKFNKKTATTTRGQGITTTMTTTIRASDHNNDDLWKQRGTKTTSTTITGQGIKTTMTTAVSDSYHNNDGLWNQHDFKTTTTATGTIDAT